ncbi:hypothetical protein Tco_0599069 [Tanacetum coccineum]
MKSAKDVTEEEAAKYEKEKEELGLSLKIISNYDNEVDYEPLSRKFPIVNWEYQLLGKMEAKDMYVYKLTRADGSLSYHENSACLLRRLDRQDLNDLYSPSGRLSVPAVLILGCPALLCKVSSLVAVETLYLGLVKPNSFLVGHVQLPSSILQESSYPHSQHSNVPPQIHLF